MTAIKQYYQWSKQYLLAQLNADTVKFLVSFVLFTLGWWMGLDLIYQRKFKKLIPFAIVWLVIFLSWFGSAYIPALATLFPFAIIFFIGLFVHSLFRFYNYITHELDFTSSTIFKLFLLALQLNFYEWIIEQNHYLLSAQMRSILIHFNIHS